MHFLVAGFYHCVLNLFFPSNVGDASKPSVGGEFSGIDGNTSGWELALVTTPSSNSSHVIESKLVCVFFTLYLFCYLLCFFICVFCSKYNKHNHEYYLYGGKNHEYISFHLKGVKTLTGDACGT